MVNEIVVELFDFVDAWIGKIARRQTVQPAQAEFGVSADLAHRLA